MAEILDAKSRIEDLLFLANHLIRIVEQENIALNNGQLQIVQDGVEEKVKLSRAYELRVMGMQQSGQNFSAVDPALREELKTKSDHLQELVKINEMKLRIHIETGTRFMEVLSDAVKSSTPNAGTYGANGTSQDTSISKKKSKTASLAINENL